MFNLLILLLERVGLIILLAYILMNFQHSRNLLLSRQKSSSLIKLIIIFSIFAIISNFTGVEIINHHIASDQVLTTLAKNSSLANTRVLTIGVSGLIGGPVVGTVVGLISGTQRLFQGGENSYIYLISSILVGCLSGFYGLKSIHKNRYPSIVEGSLVGASMETTQMLCILFLGNNFQNSLELVKFIAIPMIMMNSAGTAIFLSIIETTLKQEAQTKAVQTHDVLELANQTLPYFRSGLNVESCTEAAKIIRKFIKVSAVSITDTEKILAHVGAASDHHIPTMNILTDLSKEAVREGIIKEAHSREEIGCNHPGCPLESAIVVPLYSKGQIVGTLKMYFTDKSKMTLLERRLAEGLGNIFSSQIELGQVEQQSKLLKDAEIKSLQAQVNPHFFFNSINTISALIRVDSEKARSLLIELSHFFRSNLQGARQILIPLEQELNQVHAFLALEQARFPDRYHVDLHYEKNLNDALFPPFSIQVLVENALRHAFHSRKCDNIVVVNIIKIENFINVSISDNGFGIDPDKLHYLGITQVKSEKGAGSALENLNKRLIGLFSESSSLKFDSSSDGTTVSFQIPYKKEGDELESTNSR